MPLPPAAPNYPTLYDFEGQIEPAFQAVLTTALGAVVNGVYTSRDTEIKDAPRVEVEMILGPAMKQRAMKGSPSRAVPSAFEGVIRARVITSRPLNGDQHGLIRGTVRYALSAGANLFTQTNLPHLQILEMLPESSSPKMIDEKEQDISELNYRIWFAIQDYAWPVSG